STCPQQLEAATYSASVVEFATTVCFLNFYDINLHPRNWQLLKRIFKKRIKKKAKKKDKTNKTEHGMEKTKKRTKS
ncbi:hypothetical protein Tco_0420207, partial [Tanacetum coccineum]